jgi:3-hydroxy-9,10-secoandrosta-1,3,5(10)-triene-9,17-dione monooxygenase reductase component
VSDHASSPIDAARFRQVLGHFPTGVTVVTAVLDGKPYGMAIGSFSSVSLDPPLVAFFPGKGSNSWPQIEQAGAFCVNVLGEHQEDVCRVFAGKSDDKFQGIGWHAGVTGSPKLDGAIAWIDCSIERTIEAGDHLYVEGRVHDLELGADGGPLLFFRGGYGRFTV